MKEVPCGCLFNKGDAGDVWAMAELKPDKDFRQYDKCIFKPLEPLVQTLCRQKGALKKKTKP